MLGLRGEMDAEISVEQCDDTQQHCHFYTAVCQILFGKRKTIHQTKGKACC